MSHRRKHHRASAERLKLTSEGMLAVAAELYDGHANAIEFAGYRLCGSSGVWKLQNGSLTVRLVYKRPDRTLTWLFRGVQLDGSRAAGGPT
jgi:hypothetical protein